MQLQVNESGSWRKVITFDWSQLDQVHQAAQHLAAVTQKTHAWRIRDDSDQTYWKFDRRRRSAS